MNSFEAYFKIAKKYSVTSLMYLIIFFVIAIILVKYTDKSTPETFKSTKVDIAVYDKDHSDFSKALYQYLDDTQSIIELEEDNSVWKDYIYTHKVEYILIIPEGFGNRMENGDAQDSLISYQAPGSKYSMFVEMKINNFLKLFHVYMELGNSREEAYRLTEDTINQGVEVNMNTKEQEEISYHNIYFRYICFILPSILILGVTPCIGAFSRKEIQKRISCGKTGYMERNIQITLATVIHCMVFPVILVLAGAFLYRNSMNGTQTFLYSCNIFMHTLACFGLTFAVSRFLPGDNVRSMVANVYSLGSSFLCGVFVDRIYLPDSVQAVGHAFPAYWYMNLNEIIKNWNGSSEQIGILGTSLLMQLGFATAFLCFGFAVGKKIKI